MLISEAVKDSHSRLVSAYRAVTSPPADADRLPLRHEFLVAAARSCIGERLVLFPVIQRKLANGTSRVTQYERDYTSVSPRPEGGIGWSVDLRSCRRSCGS